MGQEAIARTRRDRFLAQPTEHWIFIGTMVFAVATAVLSAVEAYWLAFVGVGAFFLILISVYPGLALLSLVGFTFLQNLPHLLLAEIPQNLDWLDEAILVMLTIRWLVPALMGKRKFRQTPIDQAVLLFMILYFVSVLLNRVPVLNAAFGFRDVFQYLLLFYIIAQENPTPKFLKQLVFFLLAIGFIELIVLLGQLAIYFAQHGSLFIEDEATGTMGTGGAHRLGYFAALLFMAYLGLFRARAAKSVWPLFTYGLVITITSTRAVFFWIPAVLVLLSLTEIVRRPSRLIQWIIIAFVFIGPLLAYMLVSPEHAESLRRPSRLYKQQRILREEGGLLGRIGFLEYSFQVLQTHGSLLLGTGPGTYVSKTGSRLNSALYRKYQDDFPFENAFPTGTQISLSLTEYGFLGVSAMTAIFASLLIALRRTYLRSQNRFWKGLSWGTIGSLLIYLISVVSANVFEMQSVSLTIWLLAAVTLVAEPKNSRSLIVRASENSVK